MSEGAEIPYNAGYVLHEGEMKSDAVLHEEAHTCAHCLIAVDEREAVIDAENGEARVFCCEGCRGVWHVLRGTGFDEFYSRRRDFTPGPPETADVSAAVFEEYVVSADDGLSELTLVVSGIRCASCVWLIEHFLQKRAQVTSVRVNYATHRAVIRWSPARTDLQRILHALTSIGYVPKPATGSEFREVLQAQQRDLLLRFGTAGFFSMQLMLYTVALYAGYFQGMEPVYRRAFHFVAWGLSTPVVFYCGYPFIINSLRSLRNRTLNMDTLVFLGSFSAYAYSVIQIFAGGEVYFDTASMIVTLILLGRYIEIGAKGRAGEALAALMGLQPVEARLSDGTPGGRKVAVKTLRAGDMIEVLPGEKVPLDVMVVEGMTEADESMLTGESQPVAKHEGSELYGATMNLTGRIVARVIRVGKDTVLSGIISAVEEAQSRKAPVQAFADRVVGWFVPTVIAIACSAFAFWFMRTGDVSLALNNCISVMVIACPCAMGLATPLAVLVGSTTASRMGILIKGGDVLERAARADTIVFDKTGTLTAGEPSVTDVDVEVEVEAAGVDTAELLSIAAALESGSDHPIARAIRRAHRGELPQSRNARQLRTIAGRGVSGLIDGKLALQGNEALMLESGIAIPPALNQRFQALSAAGKTVVFLALEGRVLGLIAVKDSLRAGAQSVVAALRQRGLRVAMVTGDNEGVARVVAAEALIEMVDACVTPAGKAEILHRMKQERGWRPMMIGDGINDAPALTEADVGVAMGRATDIALESSSAVLIRSDLSAVLDLVDISRRSLRVIRQNLFWAFSYNFIAIPLAVSGLLHPIVSALFMVGSSLAVVGNSMRLRRVGGR